MPPDLVADEAVDAPGDQLERAVAPIAFDAGIDHLAIMRSQEALKSCRSSASRDIHVNPRNGPIKRDSHMQLFATVGVIEDREHSSDGAKCYGECSRNSAQPGKPHNRKRRREDSDLQSLEASRIQRDWAIESRARVPRRG